MDMALDSTWYIISHDTNFMSGYDCKKVEFTPDSTIVTYGESPST